MAHDSQSSRQEWRDNNIAGNARVIFGNVINHIHMTESLAQEVIRSCRDSSELFHSLAKEVAWFRSLLEITKSNVAELDATYQFSRDIETVITGISDSFTEIQQAVQRFEDFPTRTQWTWERHHATSEIRNLQKMLDSNFRCLSNLNSSLSSYSQKAIISKLEKFFRDVQSGSRQESRSSLDSLTTDEAEAWRMVRKHLEDVGITPQLFDQHHTLIKDSILEAMVSGKLDETATKDQEEEAVNDDDVPCGTENGGIYLLHHNSAGFSSSTNVSADGSILDEEGTPPWDVHRIIDNSVRTTQLQSQSESLRAQSTGFRKEQKAATRISTAGEDGNSATAEGAIPKSYESSGVSEKAPLSPVTKYISAIYHTTPDPCQQYVLSADCPVILSYEEAKSKLKEEQEMCWEHLQQPERRQVQLQTSQNKAKWKKKFHLETAEDYHIFAHEVCNRRKRGLKYEAEGRPIGFYDQPGVKRCTNNKYGAIK